RTGSSAAARARADGRPAAARARASRAARVGPGDSLWFPRVLDRVAWNPSEPAEQLEHRGDRILVAAHAREQETAALAAKLEPAQVGLQTLEVALTQPRGRAFDRRSTDAWIFQLDHALAIPRERQLVAMQDLHERDVMPRRTHQAQPTQQRLVCGVIHLR